MLTKHPLFWKEWKSAKWWCLLMMGIFLIMFLGLNNDLQQIQELSDKLVIDENMVYLQSISIFDRNFSNELFGAALTFVPIVIVMTTLLFQNDRKEGIGAFVSSLPFNKNEQFKIKWFVGAITITIPFAIASIMSLLIRAANWGWIEEIYAISHSGAQVMPHDTLAAIMLGLLQVYLLLIALYSFLMLIQTFIANNIAASVIGVITLAVPWFLIETSITTISRMLNKPMIKAYWHNNWYSYRDVLINARRGIMVDTVLGRSAVSVFSYEYYWIRIIVLFAIVGLSLYGGIQLYGRNENSRNGQLIMFDWAGKLLIIGVTTCVALLGNNGFRILFIENTKPIYEIITLTISAIIGFVLIRKIVSLSGRCKA